MITEEIRQSLFDMQDIKYRDFQAKLIPWTDPGKYPNAAPEENDPGHEMIGVRTPELRRLAKELAKRDDIEEFLQDLPHRYFDENQLHAFIISGIKEYDRCMEEVNTFLPFVDNWATCDQMSPKVFKKHRPELLAQIREWIRSDHTYTVRFGIGMLMQHFLDEEFDPAYPELAAGIRSEEYYINMMTAWYFATALAKQYESILPFIEEHRLDTWVHNKTIQKAIESYRITAEQKTYLRSLKIPVSRTRQKEQPHSDI